MTITEKEKKSKEKFEKYNEEQLLQATSWMIGKFIHEFLIC